MVLRDEGARGSRQQDEDHPHGGGDGGQRSRFGGAARSIARRGNAGVGRSGLSRTDRSDPGVRLRPRTAPIGATATRMGLTKWSGRRTGRSRGCAEEECHPTVRGVRAGESVLGAEKTVALGTGLARERRLLITGEPPKQAEDRKK